ncbi:MAG TPA: SDR family oxidoreductase [Thermomicrobiales bacterium]|nr:SDR family oxidoreductase [Thermomicrobiales bacterium]
MNHQSASSPNYRDDDRSTWGRGYGRLAGKNALVTGSTRGLGRTMIDWLAREGANIVVSGREQADVDASVAAMRELGVTAWGFPADLSRIEDAHRLGEQALEAVGQLDILVNNAGMSISNDFWSVSDDEFEYQLNVNLRSPFILAQYAARNMREHGKGGRIVNISTVGVTAAHTKRNVYNLAKGAVETMTRNMGYELGPYGVTVNCVAPGNMAERPGNDYNDTVPDDVKEQHNRQIPVGRVGAGDDIAAAVLYFCLPEAAYVTGQTLLVDGMMARYLRER